MLIGDVRVSKTDGSQTLAPQCDALLAADIEADHIYQNLASAWPGARSGRGPA